MTLKDVSLFLWLHLRNFWDILMRLPQGKFWFPVGKLPKNAEGITIHGDPEAVSRSDPRWREQWKWVVLTTNQSTDYYYLFFEEKVEGKCMTLFLKITTPGVAVRVGPGDVTFFAYTKKGDGGKSLPLYEFLSAGQKSVIKDTLKNLNYSYLVTWV